MAAFALPDVGGGLRSTAYWNLLALGGARPGVGITDDPAVAQGMARAQRAQIQALRAEIEDQVKALDRQKYGKPNADLAKRAATAIRYLEGEFRDSRRGEPVPLGTDATLEIWGDTDEQGSDADLSILRCAVDLEVLHPDTGARVLTGDFGMRLRGQQRWGLKTLRLPHTYRKPGTAIGAVVPQS